MIEIEEKSKNQRILDLVMVAMAALSSLLLIMTTDDILGDCLIMVVPIWITTILVFLRHWVSFFFCIAGFIVCALGFIFSQNYIIPNVSICAFCTVATIDMWIGSGQRDKVDKKKTEVDQDHRAAVIREIEGICGAYNVTTQVNQNPYSGDYISISFHGDIADAETIIGKCCNIQGVEKYPKYSVKGKHKVTYTTTSKETIGEAVIKQDYTEVGKIKIKGDVEHQHEREAYEDETFRSLGDAMRFAQSKSLDGNMSVTAYIWFRGESERMNTVIVTLTIAKFVDGTRLQY